MTEKQHLNYLRRKTADESELWAADRIEQLGHNYASLIQAFDEMKELAAQRLQVMREQEAEIERLKLTPPDRREDLRCVISDLCAQVREAERQRDELKADAVRYRWLRDNPWDEELTAVITYHRNALFDSAIDAAIVATRKEQK